MTDGPRRRVNVLVVAPSLRLLGGQAIQAQRLGALLAGSDAVRITALEVDPKLPGPLAALQSIKYVRTIVTSVAYGLSLLRQVPRADVVHAFSASYWSFLLAPLPALLAARLFGKPSLLNYRSGEARDHLATWSSARWGVGQATRIVVPSGYLVDVFSEFGFHVETPIPNLIDLSRLTYRARRSLTPRFLSNRNFETHYNVACTLRAFALVQAKYPDATLVLAGDGPERTALEQLARSLGLHNVTFLGQVRPDAMPALLEAADIYINSPRIDNMPTSLLEAYACGVPIVSTAIGGIPYIAQHRETARLVPDDDHAAMAAEALDLLADPAEAFAMTERARSECQARYAHDVIARAWESLYDATAAAGR